MVQGSVAVLRDSMPFNPDMHSSRAVSLWGPRRTAEDGEILRADDGPLVTQALPHRQRHVEVVVHAVRGDEERAHRIDLRACRCSVSIGAGKGVCVCVCVCVCARARARGRDGERRGGQNPTGRAGLTAAIWRRCFSMQSASCASDGCEGRTPCPPSVALQKPFWLGYHSEAGCRKRGVPSSSHPL